MNRTPYLEVSPDSGNIAKNRQIYRSNKYGDGAYSKPTMSDSKPPTRAQIVDEYGEVERKMLLWRPPVVPANPHAARYAELQAQILSWHENLAGNFEATIKGKLYQVNISARGFKSVVTAATRRMAFQLIAQAGKVDPFEVFSITIQAMKDHCGAAFVTASVPKEQTGERTVTAVSIVKAARAA